MMGRVADGIILSSIPAFYNFPQSVEGIIDHTADKVFGKSIKDR